MLGMGLEKEFSSLWVPCVRDMGTLTQDDTIDRKNHQPHIVDLHTRRLRILVGLRIVIPLKHGHRPCWIRQYYRINIVKQAAT